LKEIWNNVIFNGIEYSDYRVSTHGSLNNKYDENANGWIAKGYRKISIDGTSRRVHRIVMETFVGPLPPGMETNHIDGNKLNNNLTNLEYVTHTENMEHAGNEGLMRRKLADEQVIAITKDTRTYEQIADEYGINVTYVGKIKKGRARTYPISESHVKLRKKLNIKQVKEIRSKRKNGGSLADLAIQYNISASHIHRLSKLESWGGIELKESVEDD